MTDFTPPWEDDSSTPAEYGSVTLKLAPGYDAPWLVLRPSSKNDLIAKLADLSFDRSVENIASAVAAENVPLLLSLVAAEFHNQYHLVKQLVSPAPQAQQGSAPQNQGQPQNQNQQQYQGGSNAGNATRTFGDDANNSGAPKRFCAHGEMVYRANQISKKTGRPYSAHFCSAPQGASDQCDPVFAR